MTSLRRAVCHESHILSRRRVTSRLKQTNSTTGTDSPHCTKGDSRPRREGLSLYGSSQISRVRSPEVEPALTQRATLGKAGPQRAPLCPSSKLFNPQLFLATSQPSAPSLPLLSFDLLKATLVPWKRPLWCPTGLPPT